MTPLHALHIIICTYEFEESNKGENLKLGGIRDGIPGLRSRSNLWEWGSVHLHGPWESDSVSMDNVTNKGKHGNTAVLDFGFSQETDYLLLRKRVQKEGGNTRGEM
jgi:hypothetical protein